MSTRSHLPGNPSRPLARRGILAAAGPAALAGGVLAAKALVDRASDQARSKRRRYRIERGESTGDAVQRVLTGQLDRTLEELESASESLQSGSGAASIHEARKALKRSRTLLRVARGLLGEDVRKRENRELRRAGRVLSPIRDSHVLAETLKTLEAQCAAGHEDAWLRVCGALASRGPAPQAADGACERRRQSAVQAAISSVNVTRQRLAAAELSGGDGQAELTAGLRRIYKRGRRSLARVRRKGGDERWHDLRKRSKDLWYAAELLECADPPRMRRLAQAARSLSKLLGEDHDLAVLHEAARNSGLSTQADWDLLDGIITERRAALQSDAVELARRLYRRKPGKLIRGLQLA